jgi:hypothetical protein
MASQRVNSMITTLNRLAPSNLPQLPEITPFRLFLDRKRKLPKVPPIPPIRWTIRMKDEEERIEQLLRELEEIRLRMSEFDEWAAQNKLAEEDLFKSEERYRTLIVLSPDMIALHRQRKGSPLA